MRTLGLKVSGIGRHGESNIEEIGGEENEIKRLINSSLASFVSFFPLSTYLLFVLLLININKKIIHNYNK